MPGPLSRQLLVSAIWSLAGVVVGGRNQIGNAQIHVPTLTVVLGLGSDLMSGC